MKSILLTIPLVILTGCFNTKTTEEKIVKPIETNSTQKKLLNTTKLPLSQKISDKNVKTYTREELLKRRQKSVPRETCTTSYNILENNSDNISGDTYDNTYDNNLDNNSYTQIQSSAPRSNYIPVYTEEDFVAEDVEPVQNNSVEQSELQNYIDTYFQQLQTLNTDGIVSMTYPKFFKPINENLFRQYINTILSSSQISVESFKTNLVYLGDVYPYEGGEFAQIIYQSDITLNFLNPDLYNDELSVRVLNNVLVNKYGQENIKINPTKRTINIKKEEKLLAIKERNEEWKFIGDNPTYRRYYPTVLPAGILSQI